MPFQPIERVNEVTRSADGQARLRDGAELPDWWPEGWRNKLIWGDNKHVLGSLLEEFAGKVDLIYIDPPFDTGDTFAVNVYAGELTAKADALIKEPTILEQVAYRDLWKSQGSNWYQSFYERMHLAKDLMAPTATIYVHLDWNVGHHARVLLDELFGSENSLGEVVWNYGSPSGGRTLGRKLVKSHDLILIYAKERQRHKYFPYFLPYSQQYVDDWFRHYDDDGRRYQRRQRRDDQGATYWEKQYLDESRGVPASTVWNDIKQIYADPRAYKAGMPSEITGFATQKPLRLVERAVAISSEPGDLVLDFYSGSGTTIAAAEASGRRWIGVDIGRFGIHTSRKRMLDIGGAHPFEILNLGGYERRRWQGGVAGEAIWEYYRFIIELYRGVPISGFAHLHGEKEGRMVSVGPTDAPVTHAHLDAAAAECAETGVRGLDVLGWEWEMGLNPKGRDEIASAYGIDIHLLNIPREVMDQKAVDAGDVHFFELGVASVHAHIDGLEATLELDDFIPAVDDYMREKVGDAITRWSDWIDYWAVDWDYDGEVFTNSWQAYRTRKEPSLMLRSDPHQYPAAGEYQVVVKVIDIFGNDTTTELTVAVEG